MRFHLVLMAVLVCLTAQAARKAKQGATPAKPAPAVQQSLTGCLDEQEGRYVLLDGQMRKIAALQSEGSDEDLFAKHLGHKVEVKGTQPEGANGAFRVTSVQQIAGDCSSQTK